MKASQTIFNKELGTVTISQSEYEKLLQYKQICYDFKAVIEGGSSE